MGRNFCLLHATAPQLWHGIKVEPWEQHILWRHSAALQLWFWGLRTISELHRGLKISNTKPTSIQQLSEFSEQAKICVPCSALGAMHKWSGVAVLHLIVDREGKWNIPVFPVWSSSLGSEKAKTLAVELGVNTVRFSGSTLSLTLHGCWWPCEEMNPRFKGNTAGKNGNGSSKILENKEV